MTHVSSSQDTSVFWPEHYRISQFRNFVNHFFCESHFWPKVMTKNGLYHFYPSAKSRRELKIKTSGVIFRGASAYDVQKTIAPPKQAVCIFIFSYHGDFSIKKICQKIVFGVEKWNVGNHLKRVFPKFDAERSHPWGVNSRSKFLKKLKKKRNPLHL